MFDEAEKEFGGADIVSKTLICSLSGEMLTSALRFAREQAFTNHTGRISGILPAPLNPRMTHAAHPLVELVTTPFSISM